MFELIFGIIWTAFSGFFAFMMYGDIGGTITVNGQVVSQAEFNEMLWPKLFIGLFMVIGIVMICVGLKKIVANVATSTKGEVTYGIIVDIYPSGTRVNGRPVLNADVVIVENDGTTGRYTESVGMDYNKHRCGEFVKVKHYKKDINILEGVDGHSVPYQCREKLESVVGTIYVGQWQYGSQYYQNNNDSVHGNQHNVGGTGAADTVVINGVEYIRKEQ